MWFCKPGQVIRFKTGQMAGVSRQFSRYYLQGAFLFLKLW